MKVDFHLGSDQNKIEPAHGLSVPIFCDKELKYFQLFLVRRCG